MRKVALAAMACVLFAMVPAPAFAHDVGSKQKVKSKKSVLVECSKKMVSLDRWLAAEQEWMDEKESMLKEEYPEKSSEIDAKFDQKRAELKAHYAKKKNSWKSKCVRKSSKKSSKKK